MYEFLYIVLLLSIFSVFITLFLFKKEMMNKAKHKDFLEDAVDGIEKNFSSNNVYSYTCTNGLSFFENENKEIDVKSQSKLCGIAINH